LAPGDAATNGQGPAVALQTVYIKDLSFESPKGPFMPAQAQQDPKISLNLSTMSSNIGQDAHEVVLSVTLEAKNGDVAVYLAEVKQAGVFVVRGFGVDETRRILGSFAPNILFPYIRQTVSDVVVKGGFPPFLLPHVNFDALVRAFPAGAGGAPGTAGTRTDELSGPDAADCRAGRRLLGDGARDPVRARRRPDGPLGPRGRRAEKIARERETSATCPARSSRPPSRSSLTSGAPLAQGDDVVLVVPSSVLRAVLQEIKPHLTPKARVAWASKGFELSTGKLPHQVAREVLGPGVPIAVLSGPTFAKEVGQGLPTAIAVASSDVDFARSLAERISSGGFRAYTQTDIVGVEIAARSRTCSPSRPAARTASATVRTAASS
jgi:protein-export chaperone SecB